MADVTETFPGTAVSANEKVDVTAIPSGYDDNWWAAADGNKLLQFSAAVSRALRMQALCAFLAPATAGVNGIAFSNSGIITAGLSRADSTLNRDWSAAIEAIEQGGGLGGTASNTAGFGVHEGVVTIPGSSGSFITGTLMGLSSDGSLITHAAGARPPIGIVLSDSTAYVDLTGRVKADDSTLAFKATGELAIKQSASGIATLSAGATLTMAITTLNQVLSRLTTYRMRP
jgi:hypothetical protein